VSRAKRPACALCELCGVLFEEPLVQTVRLSLGPVGEFQRRACAECTRELLGAIRPVFSLPAIRKAEDVSE